MGLRHRTIDENEYDFTRPNDYHRLGKGGLQHKPNAMDGGIG